MELATSTTVSVSAPRYVLRPGTETDISFVANTWFEHFRLSSYELRRTRPGPFQKLIGPRIAAILERAHVLVAAPEDTEDPTVYGFRVTTPGTIHFVYVKSIFRKFGIGRALVNGLPLEGMTWTTSTPDLRKWIAHKVRLGPHMPFWLEEVANGGSSESITA